MNNSEIKILTLWHPWASLVAIGLKQVETRHWFTSYRGPIAIHAAKRKLDPDGMALIRDLNLTSDIEKLPYGAIVAIAKLSACRVMTKNDEAGVCCWTPGGFFIPHEIERMCGLWEAGRYAWFLDDIQQIKPIYCRGMQGLAPISDSSILAEIERQIGGAP